MLLTGLEVAEACFERHRSRPDIGACRRQFAQWRREVEAAEWRHYADVKAKYRSADQASGKLIFNVSGNNYRLIVAVSYAAQALDIRFMGTHREYDDIDLEAI